MSTTVKKLQLLGPFPANIDFGVDNAGKLAYVSDDGLLTPLSLGDGMSIVDGVIVVDGAQIAGLTDAEKSLISTLFRNAAYNSDDMGAVLTQLETLWGGGGEVEPDDPDSPEKTLVSISAVYSGGSVTAGTAVNDLTGIVVTAHYSDGTSETVTGYTLSGTIAEGSNTITVSYEGMTATFTVAGVVDTGGDETGLSNETTWTDGVAYSFNWIEGEYVKQTGEFATYDGWQRSPYLYCDGASRIDFTNPNSQMANYNAFYDADKQFVSNFYPNTTGYVDIPEGVAYFAISKPSTVVRIPMATPRA